MMLCFLSPPAKCSHPAGMVLEYDFDTGVVDNCNGAPLVTILGAPKLTPEGANSVLCFDGSSFMQVGQEYCAKSKTTVYSQLPKYVH